MRNKFSLKQCPKNDLEYKEVENISYTLVIGSLTQVCTCLDLVSIVELLDIYLNNPQKNC